jgi:hypothetical protein
MKKQIFVICVIVLIAFVSCSVKEDKPEYPVQTEIIEDVTLITNPEYPREGVLRDILEEELSIGLAEGPEEYMLNRPQDVKAADDGTIYILDWGDICIKVYDKDGTFIRKIGQKGQGPGDFGFLLYMDLSTDGRIFVMDPVNRRVSVFQDSGEYMGGFRFEGSYNEMKADSNNRLYYAKSTQKTAVEELPVTEDMQEIETVVQIFRSEADGEDLFLFGGFEGEKDRMKRMPSGGVLTTGSEFNIVWNVNRNGFLYQGLNNEYKINVYDPEGKHILTFGRPFEPIVQEFGDDENIRKRTMPAYDSRIGWVFDDEGNIWVSTFSENEEEVIYDVFSPQGIYMRQVVLLQRICDINKGKIYSIVSTEEGFRAVKRYRIKWSTE